MQNMRYSYLMLLPEACCTVQFILRTTLKTSDRAIKYSLCMNFWSPKYFNNREAQIYNFEITFLPLNIVLNDHQCKTESIKILLF